MSPFLKNPPKQDFAHFLEFREDLLVKTPQFCGLNIYSLPIIIFNKLYKLSNVQEKRGP